MQGTVHIIHANPATPHRLVTLSRIITKEELQEAVGGPVEVIPNFDSIIHDGKVQLCFAFCDEARVKDRPINKWATMLWSQARARRCGWNQAEPECQIAGSVALVTGDTEFLQGLI